MNVYVSTLQHSHLCYEITRRLEDPRVDIELLFTDSRERSCTHHLVFRNGDLEQDPTAEDESLVLVTDKKTATVSGLYNSGDRSLKNAATSLFEAALPRTIIRLQRGDIRPPWRRSVRSTKFSSGLTGVLAGDTIGACSDGTIYAISILARPARDLLRLVQNLIRTKQTLSAANKFTVVRHRSGDIFETLVNSVDGKQQQRICARDVDPRNKERGPAGPRNSHIDGDLLTCFFQEGQTVQGLLSEGVDDDVCEVFLELARALLPQENFCSQNKDSQWLSVLEEVEEWLKEILMPLL